MRGDRRVLTVTARLIRFFLCLQALVNSAATLYSEFSNPCGAYSFTIRTPLGAKTAECHDTGSASFAAA
jgi:hypothetical protein